MKFLTIAYRIKRGNVIADSKTPARTNSGSGFFFPPGQRRFKIENEGIVVSHEFDFFYKNMAGVSLAASPGFVQCLLKGVHLKKWRPFNKIVKKIYNREHAFYFKNILQ